MEIDELYFDAARASVKSFPDTKLDFVGRNFFSAVILTSLVYCMILAEWS